MSLILFATYNCGSIAAAAWEYNEYDIAILRLY